MTRNGIVHLDCWCTKILPLLGVLSAFIFILWGFCPMVLLSIGAFLCAPTWCWLSTPVVIVITWAEMGLYTLIVGVLKYCLFWGFCLLLFLSFGAFVLWYFCPLGLFSVRPRDVDCPHVHHLITYQKWDCTSWFLGYWNIESFGGFVRFDFYPLGLLSYGAFVHFGFSLCTQVMLTVHTCCDRDYMNRNGIVHLDCWRTKILSLLGVLSSLIFILWGFCPMLLLSIMAFLCALTVMLIVHTCCHRDHMTRIGIVHLDCWRTKILPLLGVLSALIFILWGFCPIVLLSIGAFLCAPTWCWLSTPVVIMITWPEMGLYTLIVSVLKYCRFWGFCPLWFLPFGAFVLWCFCPLGLFSVRPCDVDYPHLLWSWSHDQKWDCTPWLFFVLKYCLFWGFCPLWFLSFGAFVLWCFCPLWLFSVPPRDVDCPHVHHLITLAEMGVYTLIVGVLKYCLFWGFCLLLFLSFGAFVLWYFCPLGLFSVRPRDFDCPHVHHLITFQKWDCTSWFLGY